MEFGILGPLQVTEGGRPVALGAAKQRALLAALLLHANEVVSSDRLIDELWGERAPGKATKNVQVYVSQLRKVLGDGRLETRAGGYVLRVEPGALDAEQFQSLFDEGRQALGAGEAERAAELLRKALALWRGSALADVSYEPFAQGEIARLEELRLVALEERIDADLALGRHSELVGELESLVREEALRERPRAQLMLALYRSGRQAEALEVYQNARRELVDELGLEPSRLLQELQRAILSQDPALEPPARTAVSRLLPRRRIASPLMVGAAVLFAAALAATIVELTRGGRSAGLALVAPNSVAVIDPATNEIVASVPVGARPTRIAFGEGALWVANFDDRTLSRIDPRTRRVVGAQSTGAAPDGVAAGLGSVWVANEFAGTLSRVDPGTNTVVQTIDVGGTPVAVAVGGGAVWIADQAGGTVVRLDPTTNARRAIRVGKGPSDVAVGAHGVWVANSLEGTVSRLDPASGALVERAIALRFKPTRLVAADGAVWVTGMDADEVARLDPATNAVSATIPVGDGPTGVAVDRGSVWVADSLARTVVRIDSRTGRVLRTIGAGASPDGLAVAGGRVWVTVRST